jgi:6-phosphogluconolactonase
MRRPAFWALCAIAIGLGTSAGHAQAPKSAGKPVLYYLALEVQSKLVVFRRINNNESVDPTPLFMKDTVQDPAHLHHPAQQAGPVFVHPDGRFVYTTNRTNGTIDVGGKQIFEGGENTVAVFSINHQ